MDDGRWGSDGAPNGAGRQEGAAKEKERAIVRRVEAKEARGNRLLATQRCCSKRRAAGPESFEK